jgi:hypothetical protein
VKTQAFCEVTLRIPRAALIALAVLAGCDREIPNEDFPAGVVERGEPEAGAGLYSNLAIDSTGRVHLAYFHADLGAARHATWTGEKWAVGTIDQPGEKTETGRQIRLAAGAGKLYAAYQESVYSDTAHEAQKSEHVRFASSADGKRWTTESLDDSSFRTGDFIALGIAGDVPVVAYYDADNGDLMYADRSGGKWTIEALDKSGNVGKYVSLDVSADGHKHLAYYDASYGGLKYLQKGDETTQIEKLAGFAEGTSDAVNVGTWTVIRAQPMGSADPKAVKPKIAYYDENRHRLMLAERSGADAWAMSVVDEGPFAGTDTAFLWLADGDLVLAYFDEYNLDLKLARRGAGGWSRQTVLSQGAVGLYNALAALPRGRVALSTYSLSRGELQYLILPVRP